MRLSERLLAASELLCGPDARLRVFEPLVADWQREWHETSGLARIHCATAGLLAFNATLARLVQPSYTFSARPALAFAATMVLFATLGSFLALQPLTYSWLGAGVRFRWVSPPPHIGYFIPHALAITSAFALLPAMLLATVGSWSAARRVAAVVIVLAVMLVLEGWVAPAAMYTRNRDFIERLPEPFHASSVRAYANTAEVLRLARDEDQDIARDARAELQRKVELVAMAFAFALLGTAIGRARASVGAGVLAVTLWWGVAWTLYQALHYWSQYLVIMLSLPGAWAPWVTPATCVGIAMLVLVWMKRIGANGSPRNTLAPSA